MRWQLAKRQQGTHKTKGRAEIAPHRRKMYKQKGTGRARHHSARAPQFRGGGKAHGPVVRSHAHDLPKKVRALGLKHALSAKAEVAKPDHHRRSDAVGRQDEDADRDSFADARPDERAVHRRRRARRELRAGRAQHPEYRRAAVQGINVYDILRRDTLVLSKAAVEALEERFK